MSMGTECVESEFVGSVSCCVVGCLLPWVVVSCRLGQLTIMRSICRCVLRSLCSNSTVNVHVELPYSIVGVMVPWKRRRRPFRE